MPELADSIALRYLRETRLDRARIRDYRRPAIGEPESGAIHEPGESIPLPRSWRIRENRFDRLLLQRRSRRRFADEPLPLSELAFLLWACQGITGRAGNYLFRTAPSAGALYPLETYLCCERIDGLDSGLYRFDPPDFCLSPLEASSCADQVADACLGQGFMARGAVIFLWSAVFRRNMSKYGHRGLRYILLDAGHACQNMLLAAESIGCHACPVAAFFDEEINTLLGLEPDEESVLYAAVAGRAA
jgi:SagB-type dehydrogenase family enzyme